MHSALPESKGLYHIYVKVHLETTTVLKGQYIQIPSSSEISNLNVKRKHGSSSDHSSLLAIIAKCNLAISESNTPFYALLDF